MKNVNLKSLNPKIAVIDLAMVGDLICALPAIDSIKSNYPDSTITVVVSNAASAVLHYARAVDDVIVVDKKQIFNSLSNFRETVKEITRYEFDCVFLFHNSIGSAILAKLAKIPIRVGYATEWRTRLLTHPLHPLGERYHLSEQRLNILRRSGLITENKPPAIYVERELAELTLSRLLPDMDRKRPLILVAVGSTWKTKIWPKERISAFVNKLPVGSCSVVLIGAPNETKLSEGVTCLPVPLFNLVGKTTLDELVHIISLCDVLVTPDNGPMHIAEALDKSVISIFGPTDPKTSGMLHNKAIHLQADSPCLSCWEKKCNYKYFCMDLVSEDIVLTELKKILDC